MRPDKDLYFLTIARAVSLRSSCLSRPVGCVLVNDKFNIISTGYNGNAAGVSNCLDASCRRAGSKSGENLHLCEALHAEMNALLQCPDTYNIHTAYVTVSPCIACTKLLMNTSCKRIVFMDQYPHTRSEGLWKLCGREWIHRLIDPKVKAVIDDLVGIRDLLSS